MKERLIELILKSDILCTTCGESSNTYCAEAIADLIIADDWFRPPCKVGQTVYKISYRKGSNIKYVQETTISRIAIDNEGIWLFCTCNPIVKCQFGKLVFLTREEAEQALKGGDE